jgi:hypothetical protein
MHGYNCQGLKLAVSFVLTDLYVELVILAAPGRVKGLSTPR